MGKEDWQGSIKQALVELSGGGVVLTLPTQDLELAGC